MKKMAFSFVLTAALIGTALPKPAFGQEVSMDQALQMQKDQAKQDDQDLQKQLLVLNGELADLEKDLQKEENRIDYKSSLYIRNISLSIAAIAAITTSIQLRKGPRSNYITYGIITAAAAVVAELSNKEVNLTGQQAAALREKIRDLKEKISSIQKQIS